MAAHKFFDPSEHRGKSVGAQVKDMAIYLSVMAAVYFVFYFLFQALVWPFKTLFRTDRQLFQSEIDRAKAKVAKRTSLRKAYENNSSNPLYKYIECFKLNPGKKDPNSLEYKEWFEKLKAGETLDSGLLWAPEVYKDLGDGELAINSVFLDYLEQQVALHLRSTLRHQVKLMDTIRDLYPEFTPKFSVIPKEISNYREEVNLFKLQQELYETMVTKGVSKELSEKLIKLAANSSDVTKLFVTAKNCLSKDYSEAMALYCAKGGFDPDDPISDEINQIITDIGNDEMASAIIRGDISIEEATKIISDAVNSTDVFEEAVIDINRNFRKLIRDKCHSDIVGGEIVK